MKDHLLFLKNKVTNELKCLRALSTENQNLMKSELMCIGRLIRVICQDLQENKKEDSNHSNTYLSILNFFTKDFYGMGNQEKREVLIGLCENILFYIEEELKKDGC